MVCLLVLSPLTEFATVNLLPTSMVTSICDLLAMAS